MMPVQFAQLGGTVTHTSILDTGAADTVVPDWTAAAIGLDLAGAKELPIGLAGRTPLQYRYAPVEIQISDGVRETYRWTAVVGFVDAAALPRPWLGYAGFLQYFDAEFRGVALEVLLVPNHSFPGIRA
jgi:hypothetical protein